MRNAENVGKMTVSEYSVTEKSENKKGSYALIAEKALCAFYTMLFTAFVFSAFGLEKFSLLAAVSSGVLSALCGVLSRKNRFFALLPTVIFAAVDIAFLEIFKGGAAWFIDTAGETLAAAHGRIFIPLAQNFAGESFGKYLAVLTLCAVLSGAMSFLPSILSGGFLSAAAVILCIYTDADGANRTVIILCALLCCVFAAAVITGAKSRKNALLAVLCVAAVMVSFPFILSQTAVKNALTSAQTELLNVANNTENAEIEVVMEKPSACYLRKETEPIKLTEKQHKEFSESFYKLYSAGFFPAFQGEMLSDAVVKDTAKITVNMKRSSSSDTFLPYGAVKGENVAADEKSIDGWANGENDVYSVDVINDFLADYPKIFTQLKNNIDDEKIHSYLACEQLYRDYAYSVFTSLSDSEKACIEANFNYDGQTAFNLKLKEIRGFISDNISPESGESKKADNSAVRDILEIKRSGTQQDYAVLTVAMARYCGIPARLAEGYFISQERTENMPENSAFTLTNGDKHYWAEVYLDGIGWIPFETYPDFVGDDILFDTADNSADNSLDNENAGGGSEALTEQDISDIPPSASEDRSDTKNNISFKAVALIILCIAVISLAAARIKAAVKKRRINSQDIKISVRYSTKYALALLKKSGAELCSIPEKDAENIKKLNEQLAQEYFCAEQIFEKMEFSEHSLTCDDAEKCRKFCRSAAEYRLSLHSRPAAAAIVIFVGRY